MFVYTAGDVIAGLVVLFICVSGTIVFLVTFFKQKYCKHGNTFENGVTLDEICRDCGKNLGFIGRDK
jgi:hypothetical protein